MQKFVLSHLEINPVETHDILSFRTYDILSFHFNRRLTSTDYESIKFFKYLSPDVTRRMFSIRCRFNLSLSIGFKLRKCNKCLGQIKIFFLFSYTISECNCTSIDNFRLFSFNILQEPVCNVNKSDDSLFSALSDRINTLSSQNLGLSLCNVPRNSI